MQSAHGSIELRTANSEIRASAAPARPVSAPAARDRSARATQAAAKEKLQKAVAAACGATASRTLMEGAGRKLRRAEGTGGRPIWSRIGAREPRRGDGRKTRRIAPSCLKTSISA